MLLNQLISFAFDTWLLLADASKGKRTYRIIFCLVIVDGSEDLEGIVEEYNRQLNSDQKKSEKDGSPGSKKFGVYFVILIFVFPK